MLLNTNRSQIDRIDQIRSGNYRINFATNILEKDGTKVEGNGYLYQNSDLQLILCFFRKVELSQSQRLSSFFSTNITEGGIKKLDCEMTATDENGCSYSGIVQINPNFSIINIEESKVYNFKSNKSNDLNRVIFRGNYDVPSNCNYSTILTIEPFCRTITQDKNTKTITDIISSDQFSFKKEHSWKIILSNEIQLYLCQFDNYLDMIIESSTKLNYEIVEKIIHSLNFVLGVETEPFYYSIKDLGIKINSANKIYQTDSLFKPPLQQVYKDDRETGDSLSQIFINYFNYIKSLEKEEYQHLLKCHKRIVASSRLYPYNFGLTLAVQIERIICKFYQGHEIESKHDAKFVNDFKKLIDYVENDFKSDHLNSKEQMIKSLSKFTNKESTTPEKKINDLITKNIIGGTTKSWGILRNSFAHGSDKGNDVVGIFKHTYCCTEIYYTLIFNLIGYNGVYTKYTVDNSIKKNYPIVVN